MGRPCYVVEADGSGEGLIAEISAIRPDDGRYMFFAPPSFDSGSRAWIDTVSWSPGGSHILYLCEVWICISDLDGNLVGQSPATLTGHHGEIDRSPNPHRPNRPKAAWSPDGSRIAVMLAGYEHLPGAPVLFTMAPDGSDLRVIVRGDEEQRLAPAGTRAEFANDARWVLVSLDGRPLLEETFISLELDGDAFRGFDGCNSFGGRARDGAIIARAGGSFSAPNEIVSTARDCGSKLEVPARAYMSALRAAESFRAAGDRLEILDREDVARLVFVRQVPLPGDPILPAGTEWRLLDGSDARAATMSFLDDRVVTGATACRPYLATYHGSEGRLHFSSTSMLTSTHSCPDDARRMEGEFTDFLTWAEEFAVAEEGGLRVLRMRSYLGETLAFEPLLSDGTEIEGDEWTLAAIVEQRDDDPGKGNARTTRVVQGTKVTISF